jgi:ABC-type sulfate/molybdate transport systems ATPase subunit
MGTGIRPGPHGQMGYGKTRGLKINRIAGLVGPDTGNVDLSI